MVPESYEVLKMEIENRYQVPVVFEKIKLVIVNILSLDNLCIYLYLQTKSANCFFSKTIQLNLNKFR